MEVLAAVKGRGLAWEMESVSVIPDTPAVCARAVLMATTERKALTTAQEPVQLATTHARNAQGHRTTNVLTANPAGSFMTTSVWTLTSVVQSWLVVHLTPTVTTQRDHMNAEAVTRHVWAAWVVVLPAVRNAHVATD